MAKREVTKKVLSITIDIELEKKLRLVAEKHDRSVSYIVERCVEEFLPVIEDPEMYRLVENTKNPDSNPQEDMQAILGRIIDVTANDAFQQMGLKPASIRWDKEGMTVTLGEAHQKPPISPEEEELLKEIAKKTEVIDMSNVEIDPRIMALVDWDALEKQRAQYRDQGK